MTNDLNGQGRPWRGSNPKGSRVSVNRDKIRKMRNSVRKEQSYGEESPHRRSTKSPNGRRSSNSPAGKQKGMSQFEIEETDVMSQNYIGQSMRGTV